MCILVESTEKVLVAKNDIKVYKVLQTVNNHFISPYFKSKYYINKDKTNISGFKRSIKLLNNAKNFFFNPDSMQLSIELSEGLYSYSHRNFAQKFLELGFVGNTLFLAIIPKGSQYIVGYSHQILSEKLRITKQLMINNPISIDKV